MSCPDPLLPRANLVLLQLHFLISLGMIKQLQFSLVQTEVVRNEVWLEVRSIVNLGKARQMPQVADAERWQQDDG